jgi:hypothetical protein
MRPVLFVVLLGCLWLGSALLPLEKEEIEGKYEIGTI